METEIRYSYENNGETYLRIRVGSQTYTIRGYSRAGLKTCILIDELNVVFDMGYANERAFSFDNKLISHGHNDHIGALHMDHCARRLYNLHKEKLYIMPRQCIKPFKMIATAFSEMNSGRSGEHIKIFDTLLNTRVIEAEFAAHNMCNLIGTSKPESEYWVKSFHMDHKVKSYGYIIYRKSKKLKEEFNGLSGDEIIKIKRKHGQDYLTEETFTPLVGYTGDTTIDGLVSNPAFFEVPLLLMECTGFCPDDVGQCCEGKHIHVDDLKRTSEKFMNKKIVLFHFSQQYKSLSEVLHFTQQVPEDLSTKFLYFF